VFCSDLLINFDRKILIGRIWSIERKRKR